MYYNYIHYPSSFDYVTKNELILVTVPSKFTTKSTTGYNDNSNYNQNFKIMIFWGNLFNTELIVLLQIRYNWLYFLFAPLHDTVRYLSIDFNLSVFCPNIIVVCQIVRQREVSHSYC